MKNQIQFHERVKNHNTDVFFESLISDCRFSSSLFSAPSFLYESNIRFGQWDVGHWHQVRRVLSRDQVGDEADAEPMYDPRILIYMSW